VDSITAMPRLLTAKEASSRLNVRLARLYELARTDVIPTVRLGRQIRFSSEALEQWITDGGRALPDEHYGAPGSGSFRQAPPGGPIIILPRRSSGDRSIGQVNSE
jgi:excisionase family DNA binding protein